MSRGRCSGGLFRTYSSASRAISPTSSAASCDASRSLPAGSSRSANRNTCSCPAGASLCRSDPRSVAMACDLLRSRATWSSKRRELTTDEDAEGAAVPLVRVRLARTGGGTLNRGTSFPVRFCPQSVSPRGRSLRCGSHVPGARLRPPDRPAAVSAAGAFGQRHAALPAVPRRRAVRAVARVVVRAGPRAGAVDRRPEGRCRREVDEPDHRPRARRLDAGGVRGAGPERRVRLRPPLPRRAAGRPRPPPALALGGHVRAPPPGPARRGDVVVRLGACLRTPPRLVLGTPGTGGTPVSLTAPT